MYRLVHRGWPDSVAWKNEAALKEAADDTLRFAENLLKAATQGNDAQLAKIILRGASSILEHVTVESGKPPVYKFDLRGAGDAFLELATDIETLLSDLLFEDDEFMSSMMAHLALQLEDCQI